MSKILIFGIFALGIYLALDVYIFNPRHVDGGH